jgi:hypothetical protein
MIKVITGGTGLIGSAFDEGVKLTSKRDLRDYDKAKFAISMYKPDVVIHCAAKVGGIVANRDFPVEFLSENVQVQTNLMDAAHKFDFVITVEADEELRISRLLSRGMFISDIKARLANQAPAEKRIAIADAVIRNDGDDDHLLRQVENLWEGQIAERTSKRSR